MREWRTVDWQRVPLFTRVERKQKANYDSLHNYAASRAVIIVNALP